MMIYANTAISRIPFLDSFLAENVSGKSGGQERVYLGWGRKPSGLLASRKAQKSGGRALFLEDGFLRSYGTGQTHPPISIVVDEVGIYYDATKESSLEHMLASDISIVGASEKLSQFEQREVQRAIALVRTHRLSKYNFAPPLQPEVLRAGDKKRVLVVDQTRGDLSIDLGLASFDSFGKMLLAALEEHPSATVYLKTHPEVSKGRRVGHFSDDLDDDRIVRLVDPVEPMSLLCEMDHVYVVSSTMGFEALIAEKPVTCFGMPWYAGWGATDDRVTCKRRNRKRGLEELFAAAYMSYCRYIDPKTGERGNIFDAIDWLAHQKHVEAVLHGPTRDGRLIGFGIGCQKEANLAPIMGSMPTTVAFAKDVGALERQKPNENDRIACCGARIPPQVKAISERTGATVVRVDEGFIRSVGPAGGQIAPTSLILDQEGIYFDPTQPSALERILAETRFMPEDLERAAALRKSIVEQGIAKCNFGDCRPPNWDSGGRRVVLVVGQVEDDASILLGCTGIKTNFGLLQAAKMTNPNAFVVYKPHPDVRFGNRKGNLRREKELAFADYIETRHSLTSCMEVCDELHTLTSLSGFDALLRGLDVTTYGQPFYAGWGLTNDRAENSSALERRNRQLTIDELVAGTLLSYPVYWHDDLRGYTDAETTIRHVIERRGQWNVARQHRFGVGFLSRQWRKIRIL